MGTETCNRLTILQFHRLSRVKFNNPLSGPNKDSILEIVKIEPFYVTISLTIVLFLIFIFLFCF